MLARQGHKSTLQQLLSAHAGQLLALEKCISLSGERTQLHAVRFRTLGSYPLTAAVESAAATVHDIVEELSRMPSSERVGRLNGTEKREGYF